MFIKINQNIIASHEKFLGNSLFIPYSVTIAIILIPFLSFFPHNHDLIKLFASSYISLMLIVIAFTGFLSKLGKDYPITLQDLIYYPLHYILPNKSIREIEINAFRDIYISKMREKYKNELAITKVEKNPIEVTENSLVPWIKENIREEKSIISLITQRVLGTNEMRIGILYWSQMIPCKKIKIDNLRLILQTNQITSINQIEKLLDITKEQIEVAFNLYTEGDIVRLFTSAYKIEDYINILNFAQKNKIELKVEKSIDDLFKQCNELDAAIKGDFFLFKKDQEWISSMETNCKLGQIKWVDNLHKLNNLGEEMKNCLKGKKEAIYKGNCYIFIINKNSLPFIVFELDKKGRLIEAKKKSNEHLDKFELIELTDVIKEAHSKLFKLI